MVTRHQITAAIRAEFDRRLAQGQAGVDARRMDRDAVNRNLAKWRDMLLWASGQTPIGKIDFSGWADAAHSAARKCAARLERAAGGSSTPPPPAAHPIWNANSIDHAHALRAAAIELRALDHTNRALRAPAKERISA
jgi:hypothetical protein